MVQIVHGIMSIFIKGKNTSTVLNILIFLLVLAKFLECIFLKVNKNAFYFALRLFFLKKKVVVVNILLSFWRSWEVKNPLLLSCK